MGNAAVRIDGDPNRPADRTYLTVNEAAVIARMSPLQIRRLIKASTITHKEGLRRPPGSRGYLLFWPEFQKNFLDSRRTL